MIGLGKLKVEYFEAAEDFFHNLLSQKRGKTKADLRYVIRVRVFLEMFPDVATERMYQIRISGEAFVEDKWTFFWMLKDYRINSPGWDWIDQFNAMENGCESFWYWLCHYNGQGGLMKRIYLSLANLKMLHYKKDQSMSFENYS